MDDREIIQWDKRLANQVERGWDNYAHLHIDLATAQINQSYLIAGEFLYVEESSSADAKAKIKLNRVGNKSLDLEKGVKIETIFIEVFVTNDALSGEWLDLVFGINFKYMKELDGGAEGAKLDDIIDLINDSLSTKSTSGGSERVNLTAGTGQGGNQECRFCRIQTKDTNTEAVRVRIDAVCGANDGVEIPGSPVLTPYSVSNTNLLQFYSADVDAIVDIEYFN